MTYDELFESILTGIHMAEEAEIEMNSVIINGRKYGKMFKNCPPNMKPTIFGMSVKPDYTMPDEYDYLIQWDPPKPQTNGDRVRAMTDEELADRIMAYIRCEACEREFHIECNPCMTCRGVWIDWLKEEVSDD